ncbi:MAG: hypothetical protein AVDCRST_MAG89-1463 [uncultured Gemmatimonadetes bacterium]|uniref:TonB-dependent receptor plug domain-containing protein n=1 Tax=uncultured Gemmatimonadota bacterium TaxID=203437 RepID=A0A6J4KYZ9_9BACT|nr:MAG: hypothetical protein AVDCRST_MAG89-1463 [uncultured Gemmatimonadota bacterium]
MSSPLLSFAAAVLLTLAASTGPAAQEPTAGFSVTGASAAERTAAGARRNVLTPASWTLSTGGDAYTMLSETRPGWLRSRERSRGAVRSAVVVYLDENRLGGVETLRQIQISGIARIEYMNGIDATTRFGTNHGAGAILVTTR